MPALRHALNFGIYGPLFGAAALFFVTVPIMFGKWDRSSIADTLLSIPATLAYTIWIVPLALILGIVPGSVTGLAYGWLKSRAFMAGWPAPARMVLMALVGAAACVLFGVCLGTSVLDMVSREVLAMYAFPGAVAAAACTALADRAARRTNRIS